MVANLAIYVVVAVACSMCLPTHVGHASGRPVPMSAIAKVTGGLLWPILIVAWIASMFVEMW